MRSETGVKYVSYSLDEVLAKVVLESCKIIPEIFKWGT